MKNIRLKMYVASLRMRVNEFLKPEINQQIGYRIIIV